MRVSDGDHTTAEGYKRKSGDRKAVPNTKEGLIIPLPLVEA